MKVLSHPHLKELEGNISSFMWPGRTSPDGGGTFGYCMKAEPGKKNRFQRNVAALTGFKVGSDLNGPKILAGAYRSL